MSLSKKCSIVMLFLLTTVFCVIACPWTNGQGVVSFDVASPSEAATDTVGTPPAAIIIMSGPSGGNFYAQGASFSDLFTRNGSKTDAIPGGGAQNIIGIQSGKADLCFGYLPVLGDALNGKEPFTDQKYDDVVVFARFASSPIHIFVHNNIEAQTLEDLKGLKICGPQAGTSSQEVAFACFAATGIDPEKDFAEYRRGSMSEQAELFKDRVVDGMIISTGLGNSTMMDILSSINCKVVDLSDETITNIAKLNPGYQPSIIPANTYPTQDRDIKTISSDAGMFGTLSRFTDDEAYWITKVLVENFENLKQIHGWFDPVTVEIMADKGSLPMHPGAERYYNEVLDR